MNTLLPPPALPPRNLPQLDEKERGEITQKFMAIDSDRDGTISKSQLRTFLKEYLSPGKHPSQSMFDAMDEALQPLPPNIDLWKAINCIASVKSKLPQFHTETVNTKPDPFTSKVSQPLYPATTFNPPMNAIANNNPNTYQNNNYQNNNYQQNAYQNTYQNPPANPFAYNNNNNNTNHQPPFNPFESAQPGGYPPAPSQQPASVGVYSNPQATYLAYNTPYTQPQSGYPAAPYPASTAPSAPPSFAPPVANLAKPSGNPFSPSFPATMAIPGSIATQIETRPRSNTYPPPPPPQQASVNMSKPQLAKHNSFTSGTHYIASEEKRAFVEYLNSHEKLRQDPDVSRMLPIDPNTDQLFTVVSDGAFFCKYLNVIKPGLIPDSAIKLRPKNTFEKSENHMRAIEAAKSLGCSVVNIGPEDLIQGKAHLIMGLIWQLIKHDVLSKVSLREHPEIYQLAADGTSLEEISTSAPEDVLLRWMNYHLRKAGYPKAVSNFAQDMRDGSAYTVLMHQIAPQLCTLDALSEADPIVRATMVVQNAQKLGCDKFVSPTDIANGNSRLNLAFAAELFNKNSALTMPTLEEFEAVKRQNANLSGILDDAEARLRQILGDQQLAYELQQQEILLYRQQKLREQQQLAEQEAMLIAQQQQEEEILQQQKRLQNMQLQEQEAMAREEQRKEEQKFEQKKKYQQVELQREEDRLRAEEKAYQNGGSRAAQSSYSSYASGSAARQAGGGSSYSSSVGPLEYSRSSYSSSSSSSSSTLPPPPASRASRVTASTTTTTTTTAAPSYTVAQTPYSASSNIMLSGRKMGVFEKMGKKIDRTWERHKK